MCATEDDSRRADVNRLGFFIHRLGVYLTLPEYDPSFATLLWGALDAERNAVIGAAAYPPPGHSYPRCDGA